MQFGSFWYFQDRGQSVTATYDEGLAEIELTEALGFDEVWLAEHHFSRYGLLPSPNLILANLAARTKRVRLGNMINTLPFYQPLRLAEEFAMLDHLTHGRLNIGLGSGVVREFGRYNVPVEEAKPRFYETVELLLKAFTRERFDHDGRFARHLDIPLMPRPLQQPHPPLHVAASSPDTIRWAAEQGISIAQQWTPLAESARAIAAYRELLSRNGQHAIAPSVRMFRPVYVAETNEQARADAEPAYYRFFELFSGTEEPSGVVPSPESWRQVTGKALRRLGPKSYEDLDADDMILFGDPPTVRAKLQRIQDALGVEGFVGNFAFGQLTHGQVTRSLRLFAEEVMPAFRAAPAAAGR